MIGKVIIGNDFGNLCRYALDERDTTKSPVVLAAAGVRSWSAQVMEEDFHDQQLLRPRGAASTMQSNAQKWKPSAE
jgi:hypothetical protein